MIPNSFSEAETETKRKLPSSSSSEKLEEKDETERIPLTVLSLNMEFYHQYENANDKPAYEQYLKRKVVSVDVLCVQEDLWQCSDAFLKPTKPFDGFLRIVSSFEQQAAHDLLRKENGDFLNYDESFTSTLGNSIYVKSELLDNKNDNNHHGGWTVIDQTVLQISSDLVLPNGTMLGYRCVVCARLESQGGIDKPVQILCTHLSGGRFEDKYMEEPLMRGERARQMQHCLGQKDPSAYNLLAGDFNSSATRTKAMDGYWQLLTQQTEQTKQLSFTDFYSYMMAPFTSLACSSNDKNDNKDWHLLYDTLDGPTSRFGHVIDYFVVSSQLLGVPKTIKRVRMIKEYMEWVTPSADKDFLHQHNNSDTTLYSTSDSTTELLKESITDHNGVQVTFFLPTGKETYSSTF